jgi:tetratricopeptide (TPR) repeat protein
MNRPKPHNETGWQTLVEAGIRDIKQQNPQLAHKKLKDAYRLAPSERMVRYWLGNACRMCGDADRAELLFRELLVENAADEEAAFALSWLLREQGRSEQAADTLAGLAKVSGDRLETLLQIAGFLRDSNQFSQAITVCRQAMELEPDRADLHSMLARLLQAEGEFEAALSSLRSALEMDATLGGAWLSLAQLQKFQTGDEPDMKMLRDAAGNSLGDETDMCISFAFGKALDDLGQWPDAWHQFNRGNSLREAGQPWNTVAWENFISTRLTSGGKSKVQAREGVPRNVPDNMRRPVFIIGMLRSGTTLLELCLDRHPEITGRGELNFLARLAGQYAGRAHLSNEQRTAAATELWTQMRLQGPEDHFYVDKNPLNFRFLDTLHSVMPEARVIHIQRDGRDSCLSCYFQLFQHPDAGFSNRLDYLLAYYRGYHRLMTHWQHEYPGWIHTISYADLVDSTETTLAGTLKYLGVDWDDRIMEPGKERRPVRTASTWQARQPIYRDSLKRWNDYYEQAPDFFDTIEEIDRQFN